MKNILIKLFLFFSLMMPIISCEKFVEVDSSKNEIGSPNVFANDNTALSAMYGIYSEMLNSAGFASGSVQGLTLLTALSADELICTYTDEELQQFYQASIIPNNSTLTSSLWSQPYKFIYYANSILEGLEHSNGVSASIKQQLSGEALLVRAFCHFYLVNMFGDIPLITNTKYELNNAVERTSKEVVINKIIEDLSEAQSLLSEDYAIPGERIRPNKSSAIALLARVYLFKNDWANAITESTVVIENGLYQIQNNPDSTFLANNSEAIWQLRPVIESGTTNEAGVFILQFEPTNAVYINNDLVNSFASDDKRKSKWLGVYHGLDNMDYYYPYKYKFNTSSGDEFKEYSMVLRLAEQYLIRAEARAHQGDLIGAIGDVDKIRFRAGIPLIADTNPTITAEDLLLVIEDERRKELFTEWGHRWFDLKRTPSLMSSNKTRADDILPAVKGSAWQSTDQLYPIPAVQLQNDPNMADDQNPGY